MSYPDNDCKKTSWCPETFFQAIAERHFSAGSSPVLQLKFLSMQFYSEFPMIPAKLSSHILQKDQVAVFKHLHENFWVQVSRL